MKWAPKALVAGASLQGLMRANYECVFSTSCSVTECFPFEISHSESTYTKEMDKHCKSGLLPAISHRELVYQHVTICLNLIA